MKNIFLAIALLYLTACASLPIAKKQQAQQFARAQQSQQSACELPNSCAIDSPLKQWSNASFNTSSAKRSHQIIMLDQGQDALLARLSMIESAEHSIDIQVFIYELDDSGSLVLEALTRAAKRGVKVRLLLDQLFSLNRPELQAQLSAMHTNFELKLYSPMFNQAKTTKAAFFAGVLFRFKNLNQRMHTKAMIVDERMAIVGGRNIKDDYFDWGADYNYRDRDVWVAGSVVRRMRDTFDAFWNSERSQSALNLDDVAKAMLQAEQQPEKLQIEPTKFTARMQQASELVRNSEALTLRWQGLLSEASNVYYYADLPEKHAQQNSSRARASNAVYQLISDAKNNVLLQTPYLAMSRLARQTFRALQKRDTPVRVEISTNSLAATDAFYVYAFSHKYKRLYLRELGFSIYEFKPHPASALQRVALDFHEKAMAGAENTQKNRVGLHAKSMVVDDRFSVIGSHNFDPRSDEYNTESFLLVDDTKFAAQLSESIRIDMKPDNAWYIAPRKSLSLFSQFNYNMGKLSEKLPIFDIWPWPYATSYQLKPECASVNYRDQRFATCSEDVGDFPEVNMSLKAVYTRIITAFGAKLEPIL